MDATLLLLAMVLFLFGGAYYSANSKIHKILCYYTSKDKTEEKKWVSAKRGYVVFDDRRFEIVPACIVGFILREGIHYVLPTKVNCLRFVWWSRYPVDPNTMKPVVLSPEVVKALNKEEWVKSYARGFTPQTAKKQSMLQAYLPLISIGLIVIIGFYLYTNIQALSQHVAALQNAINALAK